MKTVISPKVMLLAKGEEFSVKQMEAKAQDLLPKHLATAESVLVILEGECILTIEDNEHRLTQGDNFVVPAKIEHQIRAIKNLKALHVMPNDIKFEFFK